MDPSSITASVIGVVAAASQVSASLYATLPSTAYDVKRTSQELQLHCDRLKRFQLLHKELNLASWNERSSKSVEPMLQGCRRLMHAALGSKKDISGEERLSLATSRGSKDIAEYYRRLSARDPIFWRLQSWITKHTIDRLPPPIHETVAAPLKDPSPQTLLLSWLVLVIAITACYRTTSNHEYGRSYLIGSLFVAFVLGALEGSDMTTVVLTNIPWCLTIGVLLLTVVHTASGVQSRRCTRLARDTHEAGKLRDIEKTAGEA